MLKEKLLKRNKEKQETRDKVQLIRLKIKEIFSQFKKDKNIAIFFNEIKKLKKINTAFDFEEAWSENYLNFVFNVLNDDTLLLEAAYPQFYDDFLQIFCSGRGSEIDSNQLNYKVFNIFMEKIYQSIKTGMSDFLLFFSVEFHHGTFFDDPNTENDFQQNFSDFDPLVRAWEKTVQKNKSILFSNLKILKSARFFGETYSLQDPYIRNNIDYIISKIEDTDNYFIKKGIEIYVDKVPFGGLYFNIQDEDLHQQALWVKKRQQLNKYDNEDLKDKYNIEPLGENKDYSAYAFLSDKLAVIYNHDGEVDSFFTLKDNPKRLTLSEVLKKEGFNRDSLSFEDYKKLLYNYKALIEIPLRETIEKDFGIKLETFSIREQIQFLNFLCDKSIPEIEKVKKIINDFSKPESKDNCIRSFLSLESDRNNGWKIIEIGEKLGKEEAEKVYKKAADLVRLAQKKNQELKKYLFNDEENGAGVNLQTELLYRAHALIVNFHEQLEKENPDNKDLERLLDGLEKSSAQIDLLASLLIASKKAGLTQKLESIKGLVIEKIDKKSFFENKELYQKMKAMYRENNACKSTRDLERLLNDFDRHLEYSPEFYLVFFDKDGKDSRGDLEKLTAFIRSSSFDGQKVLAPRERYLGATNISPLLQKFYFGENFSLEVRDRELAKGIKKLIAHVPENSPSHKILKKLGYRDVGEEGDYKDDDGKVIARRVRVEFMEK